MKRTIMILFFLTFFTSLALAVPVEVNYQGYLTDQNGAPVGGTTNMTFRLYDVDTGGISLWDSGAVSVDVANGIYSVILGDTSAGSTQPAIDPAIFTNQLWLGVEVGTDGEMAPRQRLTSVSYSIKAASADTAADADTLEGMHANEFAPGEHMHDGTDINANTLSANQIMDGTIIDADIAPAAQIAAWKIDDGPGSGLDADTVDGIQAIALQKRVVGTCGPGSSISTVNSDGSVVCVPAGLPGTVTSNYVPRSDGTGLVDSTIFDNGDVGIGTSSPTAKLDVFTSPVDVFGNWTDYDAYYNPCEHCTDTCDGNDVAEYRCPGGQVLSCEDLRNSDGEYWEYRTVECEQVQRAAEFTGDVFFGGGDVTVNQGNVAVNGGNITVYGQISSTVNGQTFYMVPQGAIIMWSGLIQDIPAGWHLCNGTNGTPDLRDRFILGVLPGQEAGETGGSHNLTLSTANMPAHTHTFTTNSAGSHAHSYDARTNNTFAFGGPVGGEAAYWVQQQVTSSNGDHTHGGTTNSTGGGQALDIRPAFYRLAFIMKL